MSDRKMHHDVTGRKYTCDLASRLKKARDMVANMSAELRPPRICIPAGGGLHDWVCGDEDIWIVDACEDAMNELALLQGRIASQARLIDGYVSGVEDITAISKQEVARVRSESEHLAARLERSEAWTATVMHRLLEAAGFDWQDFQEASIEDMEQALRGLRDDD